VISLYSDYRSGGPTYSLSMLKLLDKLHGEYKRINNLGRWTKCNDPQILALTSTISTLQLQLTTLKGQYGALQAFDSKAKLTSTSDASSTKLQKPPPKQAGDPEITEYKGFTWKWCDKCFNGTWNRTHVTAEHQAGVRKRNRRREMPSSDVKPTPVPQANLAQVSAPIDDSPDIQPQSSANIAASSSTLDFL
jgi:hypothetical protein